MSEANVNSQQYVTFQLGGMRPRSWWKEERARRTARLGSGALLALLLLLGAALYLSARRG